MVKAFTLCIGLLIFQYSAFADFEFMNSNLLRMERIDFRSMSGH